MSDELRCVCGATGVVHWQRRLTSSELGALVTVEEERRRQVLALADPEQPRLSFPPLPTAQDCTRAVYACPAHAINLELASHVHQSTCTAPNAAQLPACDCTPELIDPTPLATPMVATQILATGWEIPHSV